MFCVTDTQTRLGRGKTFLLVEHFSEKKNVLRNPSLREMLHDVSLGTQTLNLG